MAGEVAELNFATNIATIAAEVARGLQQLQTELEATGRSGTKAQIGTQFTAGLQSISAEATRMSTVVQEAATKGQEALSRLALPKGTLGGNYASFITELTKAADVAASALDPTARKQLGGASAIRAQLSQPIIEMIAQLKQVQAAVNERIAQMTGEQAAAFRRFANPGEVTKAIGIGDQYINRTGPLPAYNPAAAGDAALEAERLAKTAPASTSAVDAQMRAVAAQMQRVETAGKNVEEAEKLTAAQYRAYDAWLQAKIQDPSAGFQAIGGGRYVDPQGSFHTRPPVSALFDAAEQGNHGERTAKATADDLAAREAAVAEEKRLAQFARQDADNRAYAAQINKQYDDKIAEARLAQFKAEEAGAADAQRTIRRIGKTSYYANDQGGFEQLTKPGISPIAAGSGTEQKAIEAFVTATSTGGAAARKLAQLTDKASAEMQRSIEAERQRVSAEETFTRLIAKEPGLRNLATENPGDRSLGNGYYQLGEQLKVRTTNGQRLVQTEEEYYGALRALTAKLAQEQRLAQGGTSGGAAVDPRRGTVFDSFLGGAFGHGFDTSQKFDPSLALGNLAATAGVLARYGYEFKLIQGALSSIKTSFQDLAQYQEQMVTLDETIKSTGADSIDLGSAFSTATTEALSQNDAIAIGTQGLQAYRSELAQGVSANTIFTRSIEDVGVAMIVSGQDAQAAQKNLIAATNSFSLGSAGGSRINDAVVNAVRNYGGNRTDVYDALSSAGGAANEAGLTPEQTGNIVALIQSRTGDSGGTVGSSINRLVSRQDNAQFRGALGQLGIEDTGKVLPEIVAMSKAYNSLTTSQQQSLIVSLGGARALRDLLPLLQAGTSLVQSNSRSQTGAGAAAQAAAAQLATLSGQLKQLKTILTDVLTQFGRAGVFAGFGLALGLLKPALQGVNELLTVFDNALPGVGRNAIGIAIDVILLGKAIEVMRVKMAETAATKAKDAAASAANSKEVVANTDAQVEGIAVGDKVVASSAAQVAAIDAKSAALQANTGELLANTAAQGAATAAGAEGAVGGLAGIAARGGIAGAAATGVTSIIGLLSNPVTIAIGALIAIGGVRDVFHRLDKATNDGTAALRSLGVAKSAQDLQTSADLFKTAAQEAKKSSTGIFGSIVNVLDGHRADAAATADLRSAAFATSEQKLIQNSQTNDVSNLANTAFGPETTLAQGLQAMKDRGIDAGTQLHAVSIALGLVKDNANSAAGALVALGGEQSTIPTGTSANILSLAQGANRTSENYINPGSHLRQIFLGRGYRTSLLNPNPKQSVTAFSVQDATRIITNQLTTDGVGAGQPITDAELAKLTQDLVAFYKRTSHAPQSVQATFIPKLIAAFQKGYQQLTAAQITSRTGTLNDVTLGADLDPLLAAQQQGLSEANPLKLNSQETVLKQNLAQLNTIRLRSSDVGGASYKKLLVAIRAAEDALAQAKITELEGLRQAAEANAGSNIPELKNLRRDYFAKEITAAGNDEKVLVGIFDNMTQSEINLFEAKYQEELALAREAVASEEALLNAIDSMPNINDVSGEKRAQTQSKAVIAAQNKYNSLLAGVHARHVAAASAVPQTSLGAADSGIAAGQAAELARIQAGADPRNPVQQAQTALKAAQYQLSIAKAGSADFYNAQKAVTDARYQLAQAEQAQATAASQAKVFPGSQIEAAAAEIRAAAGELALAERGTADYYKALGDMQKAQVDYANAVLADQHNKRLLKIDTTDPVAQAREALREANAQLRSDQRQGAPGDVLRADQVKVKDATNAKIGAVFDQKFSDEKTAFDLQQISANTYLSFLEHQRLVLQRIHNKTRQQIDELNSVDQAIKGVADQMNGQWNLGDIKIPTPYEARRYIQATSQGASYQSTAVTNQHTTVNINGADTHLVEKTLWRILGSGSTGRTTTSTRKA